MRWNEVAKTNACLYLSALYMLTLPGKRVGKFNLPSLNFNAAGVNLPE